MHYNDKLDMNRIPQHIAIIMDGNGRWAKARGHERSFGHQAGVESVNHITEAATNLGVKYLTLYTFSTENWNRPEKEVTTLMSIILTAIEEELFMKNNVRLRVIGDMSRLPQDVQDRLNECMEHTSKNDAMTLVLALNYSSRWEITDAVQRIATDVKNGKLESDAVNEQTISSYLNSSFMPDPDLLIRTGGEIRLSNYLLWQSAYTELYFCDTFWPDFDKEELYKAIYDYQQRERRFGKTSEQVATK
ncbi:MAG: isoprenyl transferase [Bacteroidaceae bacterium]|nr:isoprenyl transferase [Bacteroidaceae bacterium]